MNKYIRTKNEIYAFKEEMKIKYFYFNHNDKSKPYLVFDDKKGKYENLGEVIQQGDTIEELIMLNDMLIVGEDKVQMPILVESIEYLKAWLFCHDIYKIKDFYIKVGNDWHLVAKTNDKGELELV